MGEQLLSPAIQLTAEQAQMVSFGFASGELMETPDARRFAALHGPYEAAYRQPGLDPGQVTERLGVPAELAAGVLKAIRNYRATGVAASVLTAHTCLHGQSKRTPLRRQRKLR